MSKLYLEGVIICVGYSDFLAHTITAAKGQMNKLVVVTDKKDRATKLLCEYHHVECVQTDIFYDNGDKFNKGKGINEGLKRLSKQGWVIQLDADIYLPPMTRFILEKLSDELDPGTIYGIDRMMCPSYVEWQKYVNAPKPIQEGWVYIHPTAFPMGVRIAEYMGKGYEPIGFFQMWNPMHSGIYEYPTEHGLADRTDVIHAKKFARRKRQLIPELLCIHLDSEGLGVAQMGKNWNGRKTLPFSIDHLLNPETRGYRAPWWMRAWMRLSCAWQAVVRTWRSLFE